MKRIEICTINLNEAEGRQTITWDTENGMLYTDACENPVDEYTYESMEEAAEACDAMWGIGWDLEWIEA